jgi:hypothetical protein
MDEAIADRVSNGRVRVAARGLRTARVRAPASACVASSIDELAPCPPTNSSPRCEQRGLTVATEI